MNKIYFDNWENKEQMIKDFNIFNLEDIEGFEILFAAYGYGSYDGSAVVIAKKDGKLYMTEGGHCSCYGLEDQWRPTEIDAKQLLIHELGNYSYSQEANDAFKELAIMLNPEGNS